MCINRGGENSSYANELAMVSAGVSGEAGGSGIPENFVFGIEKLCSSLERGIPVVAGVDYGPGSNNSIEKGGDGMTDHYVAIIGVTLNFSKDNLRVRHLFLVVIYDMPIPETIHHPKD